MYVGFRKNFPALESGLAFFDAPGGTQMPRAVADRIREVSLAPLSNRSPASVPGRNAEEAVSDFRQAVADLTGADPRGVVHGRSATQLTMDFARMLARSWKPGDNVVLSRLDHDCNVAPWIIAAQSNGAEVRFATFDAETSELGLEQYENLIDDRTKLVAVSAASNFIGTKPDVQAIAKIAHASGALLYVDAVHYAAHEPLDFTELGADFVVMSPYKLFGPHLGILVANPALLETLHPDKLRPSPDSVPERFELGTLPYAQLAGVTAVVDFIADQSFAWKDSEREANTRRERFVRGMRAFDEHELALREAIERGVQDIPGLTLHSRAKSRTSTLLFTHETKSPQQLEAHLATHQVVAQAGHFYAKEACDVLGFGDTGGLRVGLAPYNTERDVEMLLTALKSAVLKD